MSLLAQKPADFALVEEPNPCPDPIQLKDQDNTTHGTQPPPGDDPPPPDASFDKDKEDDQPTI